MCRVMCAYTVIVWQDSQHNKSTEKWTNYHPTALALLKKKKQKMKKIYNKAF